MNATAPEKLIYRQPEVLAILGIAKTTLWRMVNSGSFPKPIKLGERVNGWKVETVKAWLDAKGA